MTKIAMPEPVAYAVAHKLYPKMGSALHFDASFAADDDDLVIVGLITTDQAEAYADARVAESQQWLPIATAPKDGCTILLGCFNSHGKWRTMRGEWMSEEYIAEYWEEPDGVEPGWFETAVEAEDIPNCWRIEPTHWMPLPPPPQHDNE